MALFPYPQSTLFRSKQPLRFVTLAFTPSLTFNLEATSIAKALLSGSFANSNTELIPLSRSGEGKGSARGTGPSFNPHSNTANGQIALFAASLTLVPSSPKHSRHGTVFALRPPQRPLFNFTFYPLFLNPSLPGNRHIHEYSNPQLICFNYRHSSSLYLSAINSNQQPRCVRL